MILPLFLRTETILVWASTLSTFAGASEAAAQPRAARRAGDCNLLLVIHRVISAAKTLYCWAHCEATESPFERQLP